MPVSQTDRQIVDAIDSLGELEDELQQRLSVSEAGDVLEKLDALVASLEELVERRASRPGSETPPLEQMQQELAMEGEKRSVGQKNREC